MAAVMTTKSTVTAPEVSDLKLRSRPSKRSPTARLRNVVIRRGFAPAAGVMVLVVLQFIFLLTFNATAFSPLES